MDDAVQQYIDTIAPAHRALFGRFHGVVLATHPEATVVISYGIPTYVVGRRRLFVGVWKHGLSIYGWHAGADNPFIARHPDLRTSRGTVRLSPADVAEVTDDELRELVVAALDS